MVKGFKEFKIPAIFAAAMKENVVSINVMKKLGFQFVREFPDEQFPQETIVEYEITLNL